MSDELLDNILNDFVKSDSNVNFKVSDYEIPKILEEIKDLNNSEDNKYDS